MSFMIGLPVYDGRTHREEEITHARMLAQRAARANGQEPGSAVTAPMNDMSAKTPSPAMSPAPQRRHVVFPDPVAFRFVGLFLALFIRLRLMFVLVDISKKTRPSPSSSVEAFSMGTNST